MLAGPFLPFLKLNNIPLCVYTAVCLSIHALMDMGCLHLLAVVNNAATNPGGWTNICSGPCFQLFQMYIQKWDCLPFGCLSQVGFEGPTGHSDHLGPLSAGRNRRSLKETREETQKPRG